MFSPACWMGSATSRSGRPRRSRARRRCSRASAPAARMRVSVLGSERHNPFTDGGVELFDCAAQGGSTPSSSAAARSTASQRQPGRGRRLSAQPGPLAGLVRLRLPLFPGAAGDPVPRGAHALASWCPRSSSSARPGSAPPASTARAGPHALVTGRAVFRFDRTRGRFALAASIPATRSGRSRPDRLRLRLPDGAGRRRRPRPRRSPSSAVRSAPRSPRPIRASPRGARIGDQRTIRDVTARNRELAPGDRRGARRARSCRLRSSATSPSAMSSVGAIVDATSACPASLRLHREALGLDLVRAPANVR